MGSALKGSAGKLPATPAGFLPPHMRVLFITGAQRTGGWLAEAFAADSATEVDLEEIVGVVAGLTRLRDAVFDAVLISHEPNDLDALDLLDALKAGSSEQLPIVVLGEQSEQEMTALCFEVGADAYVCVNTTTTRTLIWQIARAMERHHLIAENRRLQQTQRHRLQQEHDEASRLLEQQHRLVTGLEEIRDRPSATGETSLGGVQAPSAAIAESTFALPDRLVSHYRELLRAYVIMGSGKLTEEMNTLAELLATAGVTAGQAMMLHLHVLEEMVRDLGSRSARHVMNRADILILEVVLNLAQGYRDLYFQQLQSPRQLPLPGFNDPTDSAFAA